MEQPTQQPIQEKTESKYPAKTNWKYLAIVVVLGLVAVVGILLWQQFAPGPAQPIIQQTTQLQTEVIDTSGWKTYRSDEFGFEVRYQEEAVVGEVGKYLPYLLYTEFERKTFLVLSIKKSSRDSEGGQINIHVEDDPQWVQNCLVPEGSKRPQWSKEINGIQFSVFDEQPPPFGPGAAVVSVVNEETYRAIHNQKCYRLQSVILYTPIESLMRVEGKEPTQQELEAEQRRIKEQKNWNDQILSTFRFVDVKKSLQQVPPGYDSMRIQVKFRSGTNVKSPVGILPLKLRSLVSEIREGFSLSDEELERIGAESFKLWFVIDLKPGTDPVEFINKLLDLDAVEIAEFAPLPAPPP